MELNSKPVIFGTKNGKTIDTIYGTFGVSVVPLSITEIKGKESLELKEANGRANNSIVVKNEYAHGYQIIISF